MDFSLAFAHLEDGLTPTQRRKKAYYKKNKHRVDLKCKRYNKLNKEKILKRKKAYDDNKKIECFTIIGNGNLECEVCKENKLSLLTIDHIDETGNEDKKIGFIGKRLYYGVLNGSYPGDLSNLRILCFNHNCSRNRKYLDLSWKEQTRSQRHQAKLWKEAFNFFGPCKTCGESNIKFLTISHIHNDGAERARRGEPRGGVKLLMIFRKQGWPQSLKSDFCLECFNCNCSRKFH